MPELKSALEEDPSYPSGHSALGWGMALILAEIAPGAWCQAQEWDSRIDCGIRLPDGRVVAEMVPLSEATATRIREAGGYCRPC